MATAEYRAVRNEPRVGVGDWTGDFRHGEIYEAGDEPPQIPEYICLYLVSHGLLVDARVSSDRASSPTPPVGPSPPKITAIKEV